MRFHGLKMKEINDTIYDLWTKTYQGTGAFACARAHAVAQI